jgi:septal ring factor EnvC (AmiA/AmiB activator)
MRPRVVVYVTGDELAELRREAKRQRLSLSHYTKARLTLASDTDGAGDSISAENRFLEIVMKAVAEREARLADNLRTVMVMIDNLALSTFTQAAEGDQIEAEKRYRSWQREVETTLREVRGELGHGNGNDAQSHGNGAGA